MTGAIPSWSACWAAKMTATEAATARGKSCQAAYRWAGLQGVAWRVTRPMIEWSRFGARVFAERLAARQAEAGLPTWAELQARGMTAAAAADARSMCTQAAYGWARKTGLPWASNRLRGSCGALARDAKAGLTPWLELHAAGLTAAEAAAARRATVKTAKQWSRRSGLPWPMAKTRRVAKAPAVPVARPQPIDPLAGLTEAERADVKLLRDRGGYSLADALASVLAARVRVKIKFRVAA